MSEHVTRRQEAPANRPDLNFIHDEMAGRTGSVTLHFFRGAVNLDGTDWHVRGPHPGPSPSGASPRAVE